LSLVRVREIQIFAAFARNLLQCSLRRLRRTAAGVCQAPRHAGIRTSSSITHNRSRGIGDGGDRGGSRNTGSGDSGADVAGGENPPCRGDIRTAAGVGPGNGSTTTPVAEHREVDLGRASNGTPGAIINDNAAGARGFNSGCVRERRGAAERFGAGRHIKGHDATSPGCARDGRDRYIGSHLAQEKVIDGSSGVSGGVVKFGDGGTIGIRGGSDEGTRADAGAKSPSH
jgi:hypothetical protein